MSTKLFRPPAYVAGMNNGSILGVLVLASSALLAACGDGGGAASSGSAAASGKPAASGSAKAAAGTTSAKPADKAEEKPAEMVEFDLSTADAKWKGWVAKGPSVAKVLADGVAGARVAGGGKSMLEQKPGDDTGYDIHWSWGKEDLKQLKAAMLAPKMKVDGVESKTTITKDEPGFLEWTDEITTKSGTTKTWSFVMHMNVEKTDVSCGNNFMIGAGNEAQHKAHMEGCKTLAKKK